MRLVFVTLLLLITSSVVWGQIPAAVEVISTNANVRSGPGRNYSPITTVGQGTSLDVIDIVGNWYLVTLPTELVVNARTGYIHKDTVTTVVASVAPPDDPEPEPQSTSDPGPESPGPALETSLYDLQRDWTDSQWREYDRFERTTWGAAGLEWIIPTLGHAYVDRASAGLPPALVSVGGLALAIVGSQVGCSEEILGECFDDGNAAIVWTGMIGYFAGRIWGIVSALNYAEEYNLEVARRID